MTMSQFNYKSAVWDHNISKDFWIPANKMLSCIRETTNLFVVAVKKDGIVIGHVPRKIATICSRQCGIISCEIVGAQRYSSDLLQGGLEVPCQLVFEGNVGDIGKVSILLDCKEDDKNMCVQKQRRQKLLMQIAVINRWVSGERLRLRLRI